eukprot:s3697_g1.t1
MKCDAECRTGVIFASQLTPPRSEEVWFPGNHMLLSIQEFMADNFYTPAFENYAAPWRSALCNSDFVARRQERLWRDRWRCYFDSCFPQVPFLGAMPPKRVADIEHCHVNWRHPCSDAPVIHFPRNLPLHTGGLPQPSFPPRTSITKRPHALVETPLPQPTFSRRPRSLKSFLPNNEEAPEDIRGKAAPSNLDSSLTFPSKDPPLICAQARERFMSQRASSKAAKARWCTWWAELLDKVGDYSELHCHFRHSDNWPQIVEQSLAHVGASTLDLYSRGIVLLHQWMALLGFSWKHLDRSMLVSILLRVRVASRQDAHINRIQPRPFIRCLRWFAKTAEIPTLVSLLDSELMGSFLKGSGDVVQHKEALPIPLAVLVAWEFALSDGAVSNWVKLLLGGFLAAAWASLRFGDMQRCDIASLNLADGTLRGSCFQTKVTKRGQPFAIILAGFAASSSKTSWVKFWLQQLQAASRRVAPFKPDFLIPSWTSNAVPAFETPLSYVAALRALRWAIQTPWTSPMLSPSEAQQFTLHSLKVTLLSAAAQLRLDERARRLQGHHKVDSVQLYSRDDTIDAIWLQEQVSIQVRAGWRPTRPVARGSQRPTLEPPFHLRPSQLPNDLDFPMDATLEDFQFVPDLPANPVTHWLADEISDSASSDTSSVSELSSEDEGRIEEQTAAATHLVTNGPPGCTHAMVPATVLSPDSRTFDIAGSRFMSACGAPIRASAFASSADTVKWPCHKLACRKLLDKLL